MKAPIRLLAAAVLAASLPGAPLRAQADDDFGILLMAHGGGPDWDAGVLEAVAPLQDRYPLEVAFGMADAGSIEEAAQRLEERGVRDVAVVRLFISGESWYERTRQILGLSEGAPPAEQAQGGHAGHAVDDAPSDPAGQATHGAGGGHAEHAAEDSQGAHTEHRTEIALADEAGHLEHADHVAPGDLHSHAAAPAPANSASAAAAVPTVGSGGAETSGGHGGHAMGFWRIDSDATFRVSMEGLAEAPESGEVLLDRALALSVEPAAEDVLLLAHGPETEEENARWLAYMDGHGELLRQRGFHDVKAATLREDWPEERKAAEQDIRAFVAEAGAAGRQVIVLPFRVHGFGPYAKVLEGLDYRADETGLIPHPAITRWIERQALALREAESAE